MVQSTQLFINGEFCHSESKATFDLKNPATEQIVAHVAIANKADIDRAVKAAQLAQRKKITFEFIFGRDWSTEIE